MQLSRANVAQNIAKWQPFRTVSLLFIFLLFFTNLCTFCVSAFWLPKTCSKRRIMTMIAPWMKVRNDHRSKFSNLSNWKEEAWKYPGFKGIFYPVEALIFFRLLPSSFLNWKIYCDDHSSLSSKTAVQCEFHVYFTPWMHIIDKNFNNFGINRFHWYSTLSSSYFNRVFFFR